MRRIIYLFILLSISVVIRAQVSYTNTDAANFYNQSIQLMKTDLASAINALDSCLKVCNIVGDSAIEIQVKAEQFICDLNLRYATQLYYTDKKSSEALTVGKKTIVLSKKYNSDKIQEKAEKLVAQIYSNEGTNNFKNKEYDKAIANFDSALAYNPDLYKMYLNKALVYKLKDDIDKFGENIDIYIKKAKENNDTAQVSLGNKQALDFYRVAGSKANAANKLNDAIEFLNRALTYGQDKDVFYYLSDVYNKQKNYDKALDYGQKGLELENGDATAKAKYHYSIGVAYLGKGDKESACAFFKKAQFGQFAQAAKAQIINNKCDNK